MRQYIILFLCIWFLTTSATYYVRSDGQLSAKDNATIDCSDNSTSMNATSFNGETFSGDDVVIFCNDGGNYTDTIVPPSSGTAGHLITYRSETGQTTVINGSEYGINNTQSYVEIRGFEVLNQTAAGIGVYIHPGSANISYVYLYDMKVHDTQGTFGMFIGVPAGEEAYTVDHAYVYDSQFYSNYGTGLGITGWSEVSNIGVYRCTAYENNNDDAGGDYQQGITVSSKREIFDDGNWTNLSGTIYYRSVGYEPAYISRRVIQGAGTPRELTEADGNYSSLTDGQWDFQAGNLYINIGGDPTNVEIRSIPGYTHDVLIQDCTVYGNYGDANVYVDDGAENVTIDRCVIYGEHQVAGSYGGEGINARAAVNLAIQNTLVYENDRDGIVILQHSTGTTVYHTTIVDNIRDGIRLAGDNGGTISLQDSIFATNGRYGANDALTGYTVTEQYNDFYGNTTAALHNIGGGTPGTGSITGNPLFVSAASDNYQLSFNSPAINSGANLSILYDLNSIKRPQYYGYDMGAYEYIGPSGYLIQTMKLKSMGIIRKYHVSGR